MASDSSAKAGSKALRGNDGPPLVLALADSRKEERDEGRSGVVGRETLVRDVERFRSCDMILVSIVVVYRRGSVAFLSVVMIDELAEWPWLGWILCSDALLSRLTIYLLFGPVGGAAIDNHRPNLGILARAPGAWSGGVPFPGAQPARPSCRAVPGQHSAAT